MQGAREKAVQAVEVGGASEGSPQLDDRESWETDSAVGGVLSSK